MKAIVNGRLITPGLDGAFRVEQDKVVVYEDRITEIIDKEEFDRRGRNAFEEVHYAQGQYVAPGFINLHIHGCAGSDTMDCRETGLRQMALCQAATGVTSMLPTTMTYDMPRVYEALDTVRQAMSYREGARIIGANMEGPFISEKHKGAQKASNIQKADFDLISDYGDIIRLITIAPEELPADSDFIKNCRGAGIRVSLGHTAADYECAMDAINRGATHITHLFNAMTGLHHRNPGVVGAALDSDAFCELIADNIHVAPGAQRIVNKVKGNTRTVLITDSMRACGLGDGESELGGQKVFVSDGKAVLEDGTIAGSVLTMDRAIYNYANNLHVPVWQVVECATITPARGIGMEGDMGSIEVGKMADFAVFDANVNVAITICAGKTIYLK
ncbi:N-acetylglucosamine-6-phosphate deacetylase [Anaerovibrio sp. JC8]|uniref:N-acetylglucosamine-6-phosphate deacetylase n=1 Tax=Anaerovibrio sp. JC8 TaxID=1240085 RepID=UPI000A0E4771|nr:N-acetylglucosamine-6-phosphate deacetylase [Anaerovibrio sp. JC8]ORU01046.1 N-acetylglucosamine-6-phosphate deacetylase [Anaerovibrio sp. JC8]